MYGAKLRIRLFLFHFELVRARCIAPCRKRIHANEQHLHRLTDERWICAEHKSQSFLATAYGFNI